MALSSMELGFNCCSIHLARPMWRTPSTSPGRGPYARRFNACRIASSELSSVIGKPLSAGSAFFLSLAAAGIAALAGNSKVSEKTQAKESTAARTDLGVAETVGNQ